jgi:phytoene dehydrogenase-like protein
VTVLESQEQAGGQALTSVSEAAIAVDTGPVAFTLPAVIRDLFRKTGRPIDRCVDLVPSEDTRHFVTTDGTSITLPNASRAGTMSALDEQIGNGAGEQWDRAINAAGRMWNDLRPAFDVPFTTRTATRMITKTASRRAVRSTLSQFSAQHLADPRLRELLHTYVHRLGVDPSTAPAALAILAYLDQTFGLWKVEGGFRVLFDALLTRAEEKDADVRYGAPARQIVTSNGRITGVATDNAVLDADLVVCTTSAHQKLLGDRERVEQASPVGSLFTVVVPGAAPADQVTIIDEQLPAVSVTRASDQLTAISAPCPPQGGASSEVDWSAPSAVDDQVKRILEVVARAGVGPAHPTKIEHVCTPLDLERQTGAQGGRIGGRSWLVTRQPLTTPRTLPGPQGLILAGAGAHPGPTVPFSLMSGGIAADHVGWA